MLRISDEDRHQVAEILREAAGEGRIDLDELDERLEATYAARTYADLVPITLDLPAHPAQATRCSGRPRRRWSWPDPTARATSRSWAASTARASGSSRAPDASSR